MKNLKYLGARFFIGLIFIAAICFFSHSLFANSFLNQIPKFVDKLTIPLKISFHGKGPFEVTLTSQQFKSKLHSSLPETTQWGYNGISPGPTIDVETGQTIKIHWKNGLPLTHLFPEPKGVDMGKKLSCLSPNPTMPDVRTVTHIHGAVVSEPSFKDRKNNNDGWPDSWIVPGEEQITEVPNQQNAMTTWYHDHAMGETGRNVAAGLAGMYIIHDSYERSLNLPIGDYDIPLFLRARTVEDDGSLTYTKDLAVEYYGNSVEVNGILWPYLSVEPRKYRFRVLNGSNARSYSLTLVDQKDQTPGPVFYQIASDGGFLEKPVVLNDLDLAPAERADLIIDFSKYAGRSFVLHNTNLEADEGEIALPEVMLFKVDAKLDSLDTSVIPAAMKPIVRLDPHDAKLTRQIVLGQKTQTDGTLVQTLNGKMWEDPITERPEVGSTEVWELLNTLTDTHPFHIHLIQFQVLDRRLFDVQEFLAHGDVKFLDDAEAPDDNELGWKDTVQVYPQMVNRIIMKFLPFTGYYVYHCHILEHEDMDMMRPFQVIAKQNSPGGEK